MKLISFLFSLLTIFGNHHGGANAKVCPVAISSNDCGCEIPVREEVTEVETVYQLQEDMYCSPPLEQTAGYRAIHIKADKVILNLNKHAIYFQGSDIIRDGTFGVTIRGRSHIKNGAIRGFGTNLQLKMPSQADFIGLVEDIKFPTVDIEGSIDISIHDTVNEILIRNTQEQYDFKLQYEENWTLQKTNAGGTFTNVCSVNGDNSVCGKEINLKLTKNDFKNTLEGRGFEDQSKIILREVDTGSGVDILNSNAANSTYRITRKYKMTRNFRYEVKLFLKDCITEVTEPVLTYEDKNADTTVTVTFIIQKDGITNDARFWDEDNVEGSFTFCSEFVVLDKEGEVRSYLRGKTIMRVSIDADFATYFTEAETVEENDGEDKQVQVNDNIFVNACQSDDSNYCLSHPLAISQTRPFKLCVYTNNENYKLTDFKSLTFRIFDEQVDEITGVSDHNAIVEDEKHDNDNDEFTDIEYLTDEPKKICVKSYLPQRFFSLDSVTAKVSAEGKVEVKLATTSTVAASSTARGGTADQELEDRKLGLRFASSFFTETHVPRSLRDRAKIEEADFLVSAPLSWIKKEGGERDSSNPNNERRRSLMVFSRVMLACTIFALLIAVAYIFKLKGRGRGESLLSGVQRSDK